MFHHKAPVYGCFAARAGFSDFIFFASFKVIASFEEQLKISFRRCSTHFSTAKAVREEKSEEKGKIQKLKRETWKIRRK